MLRQLAEVCNQGIHSGCWLAIWREWPSGSSWKLESWSVEQKNKIRIPASCTKQILIMLFIKQSGQKLVKLVKLSLLVKQKELGNEWSTSSTCSHWRPSTWEEKADIITPILSNPDQWGQRLHELIKHNGALHAHARIHTYSLFSFNSFITTQGTTNRSGVPRTKTIKISLKSEHKNKIRGGFCVSVSMASLYKSYTAVIERALLSHEPDLMWFQRFRFSSFVLLHLITQVWENTNLRFQLLQQCSKKKMKHLK